MIVIPALHPSRELLARVDELRPGTVHRTSTTVETVGGKALNVARFARSMGGSVRVIVLAGDDIADSLGRDPILSTGPDNALTLVPSGVPTRIDLAVVDRAGTPTVVNGTASSPTRAAVDAIEASTIEGLQPDDVLVLAGSLPPGTDGILDRLTRTSHERGVRVIVDASGPWLADAIGSRPDVVKINEQEADDVAGAIRDWRTNGAVPAGFDGIDVLAVTLGARGLLAWIGSERWRITPPPRLEIANTLGAGDAVTAGLALRLAEGRSAIDGLRLGIAMAAARLRHFEISLDPADVPALERALAVDRLS